MISSPDGDTYFLNIIAEVLHGDILEWYPFVIVSYWH